ncbi:MAG: YihY/virulence factor BrkB family protein [Dehalococcoidia bacterium]
MATTSGSIAARAEDAGNKVELAVANGLPFGKFVRATIRLAQHDRMRSYAGSIAYHTIFACFPCLFTLFWFVEGYGGSKAVDQMLKLFTTALPQAAGQAVQQQFAGTANGQASGDITFGAIVALLVSILAVVMTMRATMEAMNAIYQRDEHRPRWKKYLIALALSVAVTALLVGALLLAVFGSSLAQHIGGLTGYGPVLRWAWAIVTWPILALGVLVAFALVYYYAPDLDQQFRWISDGSVIATILWVLFAVVFSVYINYFAAPTRTYGALAGIAVLMVYVYGSAFVLLLGAEMNRVIEAHRANGGEPAAHTAPKSVAPNPSRYPQGDSNP